MDTQLIWSHLDGLPRLAVDNCRRDRHACKICRGSSYFFDVADFNKFCSVSDYYAFGQAGIPVPYLRCVDCGFMYTEFFDGWRPEQFARWIYNADYILVDGEYREARPTRFSAEIAARLRGLESTDILDYGSGAGVFSERMRLEGFPGCIEFDPFSAPARPARRFDLITCFEVLEHSPDPVAILEDMKSFLRPGGCILFSQALQPPNILEIRASWWYVAPRNGHLSLYTVEALTHLAQRAGLSFCGRDGLFLFRSDITSAVTEKLFEEFRPVHLACRFSAPGEPAVLRADDSFGSAWHSLESDGRGAYRWTSRSVVTWLLPRLPCYPAELLVSIPILMQAYAGVLDEATVIAGDESCTTTLAGSELRARVTIQNPETREISLQTREPCSPAELRGASDERRLGVAIHVADEPG